MGEMRHSKFRSNAPVVINGQSLAPIEVDGQRVVTLAMIDKVHGRADGTARRNFNSNKDRLTEGEDFVKMSADEFRTRFPGQMSERATSEVTVMTETGYLMLVKSLNDDLAWKIQKQLVKAYFTKPQLVARYTDPREQRLTMSHNLKIAQMAGLSGNQALLSANRATVAVTGIDTLALMGITHMPAPQNDALLSPSEIADRIGGLSGQKVNNVLCDMGLQDRIPKLKGGYHYTPTDAGKNAGGVMQDTAKNHSDGTPVRQLKWASSICDVVAQYLKDHAA